MRYLFYFIIILAFLPGCKKESNHKVDIYMLDSFKVDLNQTTNPHTISISNAVLASTPLVPDNNILYYTKSTTTFKLKKDIKDIIKNYGSDKAFAVTVDNQPVYFGKIHPGFLSSMTIGVATIDPILYHNNELPIQFITITGSSSLLQLDKRNDSRIINVLKETDRVR